MISTLEKNEEISDLNQESHLYFQLRLLQLWGLWPYKSDSRFITVAHYIYSKTLIVLLTIISCQQLLQMTISPDLENISAAIDVASLALAAIFRQLLFALYIKDFKKLVDSVDSNFLAHRLPYTVRFDIKAWLNHTNWYTVIYVVSPIICIIVWVTSRNIDNIKILQELEESSLVPDNFDNLTIAEQMALNLTSVFRESTDSDLRKTSSKRRLPINCWYPTDSGVSPMFEIAFVWETTMAAVCGVAYTITDSFFFMIIYLLCAQLEILKTSLLLLEEDYEKYNKSVAKTLYKPLKIQENDDKALVPWEDYSRENEIKRKMNEALFKCIDFHNEIISIIQTLDMMLRSMIVVDFIHAVVSLSFAMLQTIIANTIYEWVQMVLFIGVCILHQFFNNLFAEILTQQQMVVAEAAYSTPWVEGSDTFKTAVYMTMVQARCPTRLSGWKMYVLGLSTFVDFMKLLFSYFLVLQSLHAEETSEKQ